MLKNNLPEKYQLVTKNIISINEDSLGGAISNINAYTGYCNFDLSKFKSYAKQLQLTNKEQQMCIASTLVHESYHRDLNYRGIQDTANGISRLESEVLAESQRRQTLISLGASKKLLSISSVDWIIDTNYNGTLP